MNSDPLLGSVRKASGWSTVWGVLMVICGLLAITLPLATSIGIVILLAWLILFAAVAHLIFAFHSHSVGGFLWKVLLAVLYGLAGLFFASEPNSRRGLSHPSPWRLPPGRRHYRNCPLLSHPQNHSCRLGTLRWYHYSSARLLHLGPLAVKLGLGNRDVGWHQPDLQRYFEIHACVSNPSTHVTVFSHNTDSSSSLALRLRKPTEPPTRKSRTQVA